MNISIIIPCLNEEKFIGACIRSVLNFDDLHHHEYEILILDGMSTDGTRRIIQEFISNDANIVLIDNEKIIQASALNIGIGLAKGDFIMRLDAHCKYPPDYLKLLLETALQTDADNVGGVLITKPNDESYAASVVQAITTHKFGVGNSGFRVGMSEGEADTVPFGFFNARTFSTIGNFDERLVRCQDYEFNRRIKKFGGKIRINPQIQVQYFNQRNLSSFLKKQLFKEAPYNAYMWYLAPYTFNPRHAITVAFALFVIFGIILSFFSGWLFYLFSGVMILYFVIAFGSAVQQAIQYKRWKHIFVLPFCFFAFHFIHGLGTIMGFIHLVFRNAPFQKMSKN